MNFGSVLSCTPHLVENIFQHLTAKDLSSCASVCSLWSILSQEEIRKRKKIVPFLQGIKCGKHRQIHQHHQDCSIRQASKFESELKAQLENVHIKPAFCIAFATCSLFEHFDQLFPSYFGSKPPRKRLKKCCWDYFDAAVKIALKKHLPPSCCISLYVESDIIFYGGGADSKLVVTNGPAICGYLFPKLPDGEVKFYKRKESTGQILRQISKNGQNIKSTLNLVEFTSMPYFQIGLNELRHRHDALTTGVIMPVQIASNYVPAFEGPNVQVFRFTVENNVLSLEDNELETTMQQWRNEMKEKKGLTDNTIAFMFSIEHDNCYEVCQTFEMVYPGVPLVGLFKYTPLRTRLEQEGMLLDFFGMMLARSCAESGLLCQCVFIFVTFKT